MTSLKNAAATGALLSVLYFNDAVAQEPCAYRIPAEKQRYTNISGNEFPFRFTSTLDQQGVTVMLDPDEVAPVIHPSHCKFYATPFYRFLQRINSSLTSVPGGPTQLQIDQSLEGPGSNSVDARTVGSMWYHLVHNHGVPEEQIWRAVDECVRRRHAADPAFRHIPVYDRE